MHNTYLSTLTELGIVGLVFLVGLLTATVLELRRIARRSFAAGDVVLGRTANAILLSLVGWQVTGVFNEFVAARPGWILIGLTLALSAISRRGQLRGQ